MFTHIPEPPVMSLSFTWLLPQLMDTLYFEFHRSNMSKQIRSKPLFPHSLPHSSCCLSIPEGTLPELPSGMVVVVGPHLCSAPLYEHRAAQTGPICPALLQSHCSHCSTQSPPSCCLPALHCKDHIQGLSDPRVLELEGWGGAIREREGEPVIHISPTSAMGFYFSSLF